MLHMLISIAGILLTILFVVGTHETGHFLAARLVGVKVLTFSIGFGKTLFKWSDKSGTEYVFALIPLGGYIRMLDQTECTVPENELDRAYNTQPFYKKMIIVLAGPLMNFVSALFLYWLIFIIGFFTIKPIIGTITPHSIADEAGLKPMQEITRIDQREVKTWTNVLFSLLSHTGSRDHINIGVINTATHLAASYSMDLSNWKMNELNPDPLQSLGILPYEPPIKMEIGSILEGSPAAHSDLKIGDKLIAINHEKIKDWTDIITRVRAQPNQLLTFSIERSGKKMDVPVKIGSERDLTLHQYGILGIAPLINMPPQFEQHIQYGPLDALVHAFQETYDLAYFNMLMFGKMLTGKLSLQSLGGPITIFDSAGTSLNYGFLPFLSFLAFLSLSIGIINLFPIPGLDGGHLFLQFIERLTGRPIPENIIHFIYRMGFLFLIFIILQALVNDILRMI